MAVVLFTLCLIPLVTAATSKNGTLTLTLNKSLTEPLVYTIVLPVLQTEVIMNSLGLQTDAGSQNPNETSVDKNTQVTSIAMIKLWGDLRTTKKSMQVLTETILSEVKNNPDSKSSVSDVIAKVDAAYRDSSLGKQYELLKEKAGLTMPKLLSNGTNEAIFEAELGPGLMLLVFTQQLMDANKTSRLAIAEAYFTLASDGKLYDKVQRIFDQILKDVAKLARDEAPSKQETFLFTNLRQKIVQDEELKAALSERKIVLPESL